MTKVFLVLPLVMISAVPAFAQAPSANSSPQTVRPIGVVTQLQSDRFTLRTDAGPEVAILLGEGVSFLRVPPGATTLEAAAKITLKDISAGDRVLVRGKVSDDKKSISATTVVVMTKSDLASARDAERLDWQRRGIRGTVQTTRPESGELTILAPSEHPTAGNLTHAVTVTLTGNAVFLRYAPDSVNFADAKPSTFAQIKQGDQLRALGTKSDDGSRFVAEKIISGTLRTLTVAVVSVEAQNHAVNGNDKASGQLILVRTNPSSKLIRLTPEMARQLSTLNAGGTQEEKPGDKTTGPPPDMEQMLARAPALDLGDLKPGDALIVVSTEGTKSSEVMAIDIVAGVEPILAARPKGSDQVVLGPWSLGVGGGEGGP